MNRIEFSIIAENMIKMKFGRSEVQNVVQVGDVDVWIRGEFADGTPPS